MSRAQGLPIGRSFPGHHTVVGCQILTTSPLHRKTPVTVKMLLFFHDHAFIFFHHSIFTRGHEQVVMTRPSTMKLDASWTRSVPLRRVAFGLQYSAFLVAVHIIASLLNMRIDKSAVRVVSGLDARRRCVLSGLSFCWCKVVKFQHCLHHAMYHRCVRKSPSIAWYSLTQWKIVYLAHTHNVFRCQ
jgi:hypothetical protein